MLIIGMLINSTTQERNHTLVINVISLPSLWRVWNLTSSCTLLRRNIGAQYATIRANIMGLWKSTRSDTLVKNFTGAQNSFFQATTVDIWRLTCSLMMARSHTSAHSATTQVWQPNFSGFIYDKPHCSALGKSLTSAISASTFEKQQTSWDTTWWLIQERSLTLYEVPNINLSDLVIWQSMLKGSTQ